MKKIYNILLILMLSMMPLLVSGCMRSQQSDIKFKTTGVTWIDMDTHYFCEYQILVENNGYPTYIFEENFTISVSKENVSTVLRANAVMFDGNATNSKNYIIIDGGSDNIINVIFYVSANFHNGTDFYGGEIKIYCFGQKLYTGTVGINE